MRRRTETPAWATELIERVCSDYNRRPARIRAWWTSTERWSSGTTYTEDQSISIRAGHDEAETREVLLHELAHYLVGTRANHTKRFWIRCWSLHEVYGDPVVAWGVEHWYRQKAVTYAPAWLREMMLGIEEAIA